VGILWWFTLGLLAVGYFALAGYDYGIGILLRLIGRDEPERRRVLGAAGPFLLGNEVWLVALAGVLLGVFPKLEGRLFSGAYPVVLAIVLGVIVFTVAVQLRGRIPSASTRIWDALITAGASVTAIGWGVLLGNMLQGLPLGPDGYPTGDFSGLIRPGTVLFGVLMFALFTLHGATFLAVRSVDQIARRAVRTARLLIAPCVLAVIVSGLTLAGGALMLVLLLAAGWALARGRSRLALGCTATVVALPVLIVAAMHFPDILVSSVDSGVALRFADAGSSPEALAQIGWLALPVVPVVIGFQLMTWWAFRSRVDSRTRLFW
jgi:cytochrome d ubiquinol oxidase subunit II